MSPMTIDNKIHQVNPIKTRIKTHLKDQSDKNNEDMKIILLKSPISP